MPAFSARGSLPAELFNNLKFIHYDLYDFRPEDQALWEASRYAQNALWVNVGSVALKEAFVIDEAHVNLQPASWIGFHADLTDYRPLEAEVGRLSADAQLHLTPTFSLLATGSPDVLKDQGALGIGAMLNSRDRTQYAVLRLIDDRPFFNGKNFDNGQRDTAVYRLQTEMRWSMAGASAWLRADLGTPSNIHYPVGLASGRTAEVEQRSDVEFHLRWTNSAGGAIGLRGMLRVLENSRTEFEMRTQLRRALAYGRAYAVVPVVRHLQAYAVLLAANDQGHGLDADKGYQYHRWDLGLRAAGVVDVGDFSFEGAFAVIRSERSLSGVDVLPLAPISWADKLSASVKWSPSPTAFIRLLISHEITGRFGGMNFAAGIIF
jgi:hypothetical protein